MANQESTAINDLIQLVRGGGRIARPDEDPVPELFVPAYRPPQPAVTGEISARQQRTAAGTPAPYFVPQGPYPALPPVIAQGTPAPAYRVPLVEQHVHAYRVPHEAYQPALPPHVAQPAPHVARSALAPAQHVAQPAPHVAQPAAAPAQHVGALAYRTPLHVEHDEEETELWQGTPRPELPTPTRSLPVHALPMQQARPVSHPYIPTRPDLAKLPRELSPAIRYAGLGVLALIAISIGAYLGASSDAIDPADDRDRAVAIMSGELPAPRVTAPVAAPAKAVASLAAPKVEPKVEPIEEPVKDDAEVVRDADASEASDANDVNDVNAVEIEMDPVVKQPALRRRAARTAPRAARAAFAVKAKATKATRATRTTHDEIEALLADKPKKKTRAKLDSADDGLAVTEVRVPKGAAAVKGTGRVTIKSNRQATIFIDGRSTGRTAPAALVIPAGDHQITLLDPSTMKAKTATIKLEANHIVAIHRDFN